MTVFCVANLKGGTAKSTSAAFIAHGLPGRVLVVDADPPGSLLSWSELASWEIPVIGLPVKDVHSRLPGVSRGFDHVVIDTPPLEEQGGIVRSALRAADVALVPVSPSTIELERLTTVLDAIEEVDAVRANPVAVRVLLNRVVTNARSGPNARKALTNADVTVLEAMIPLRQRYALAFPKPIKLAAGDPYQLAADELMGASR